MGKTSSEVKDRYNAKTYDEIKVRVPKGDKETIQAHAEAHSESVNGFINRAISETMERDCRPTHIGKTARVRSIDFLFKNMGTKQLSENMLSGVAHILSLDELKTFVAHTKESPARVEIIYEIESHNELYAGGIEVLPIMVQYRLDSDAYMVISNGTIVEKSAAGLF